MSATPYLLDNADAEAARRMEILAKLYDSATHEALIRVGLAPGWQCLEVGGGGGSVAAWMAERCAPGGSVLCTDIDPRHIAGGPANLRVERHDITRDPLPAAHLIMMLSPKVFQPTGLYPGSCPPKIRSKKSASHQVCFPSIADGSVQRRNW